MNRRLLTAGVLAAGVVAAVAVGVSFTLGQQEDDYAARVNGDEIERSDVDAALAIRAEMEELKSAGALPATAELPPADESAVLEQLIEERLLEQEADRRGLGCSDAEVETLIDSVVLPGAEETALLAAVLNGLIPASYVEAPMEQRTPAPSEVIASFKTDARVRSAYAGDCAIGKLYQSETPPGPADLEARNQAIAALKKRLSENASIDRSLD